MKLLRLLVAIPALAGLAATLHAEPKALPDGKLPDDSRYAKPTTLEDYHPFRPVASKEAWLKRQKEIRQRCQVGAGLWPMPEKTPLNAQIYGKIEMGDYTVEKVTFESMPGHYVTASLWRPAGDSLKIGEKNGKRPGVLSPHGHWANARFLDNPELTVKNFLANGDERFVSGARNHEQARCVQLARMGCVVLQYDTLGNSDSIQFPSHRDGPRASMTSQELGKWGFVSPQAQGWLQTNFGLQTLNSIRAVDFLLTLPEVDDSRLLVTGASGGATQTMMAGAIDDRVDATFPCVMVSTAMQGGCTCENTHFLRIGQGNIDIAACVAPNPQGLTAADDWTRELKTKGHPDLLALYKLAGGEGKYEAHFDIHFKHNYNHVSRTHLYNFVNRHFGLGLPTPVLERDFELLGKDKLSVWDAAHPAPSGDRVGEPHERAVCKWWTEDAQRQIAPLLAPKDTATAAKARDVLGVAQRVMIGREMPDGKQLEFVESKKETRDNHVEMTGLIRNHAGDKVIADGAVEMKYAYGEEIPAVFLHPTNWNGRVVIWAFPDGKAGLYPGGHLREEARQLVAAGIAVMSPDLFRQGEFLKPGETALENPKVQYPGDASKPDAAWRLSSVYYYGYNHSLFAQRVHDLMSCVSFVRHHPKYEVKDVALVGLDGAGHWVAAARAIAGDQVNRAAIATGGFRFGKLESDWAADFIPGGVKCGDLAGWLVQSAPHKLWLSDPDPVLKEQVSTTYATNSASPALTVAEDGVASAAVKYLLAP